MLTEAPLAPHVADAWSVTRGAGVVLAVVDVNVDVDEHPEFAARVLPGHRTPDAQRRQLTGAQRTHGTKVAGLALANGRHVTGVAPDALLLPVSVPTLGVGEDDPEADALRWAAAAGADVVCCAWAPPLAAGSRPLPSRTREALDYCITEGRHGKGCVLVFAAGNDGLDVALNGYATHRGVITVGACNAHGHRPSYSNWGSALWCVFPSNDPDDPTGASISYHTTAPVGSLLLGESFYSSAFGFTSAACAIVAGACALILSANPGLTSAEVKDVLRASCETVNIESGTYDAHGHSPQYGYGRPDIARAVRLAQGAYGKRQIVSV
jgi:subtilisin family serine protease